MFDWQDDDGPTEFVRVTEGTQQKQRKIRLPALPTLPGDLYDLLVLAGVIALAYGLGTILPALGWIAAGLALAGAGVLGALNKAQVDKE